MTQVVDKVNPKNKIGRFVFKQENAMLAIVLAVLIIVMGFVTHGLSVRAVNVRNILLHSSEMGLSAIGQAFVILTAGIDLSVGGIGLFAATLGASLMTERAINIVGFSMAIPAAVAIMVLVGGGWGAINATLVSRVRVPALIATLGMMKISQGAAFQVNAGHSITGMPDALAFLGQGSIGGAPIPVIIFFVVAAIAYLVLGHTSFGRSVYATGGNPVSAWLAGINVKNILFSVYLISGLLAGLAGALMTARVMTASMRTLEGLELETIASVCIGGVSLAGGKGNIIGVVLGVLIMGVIGNTMNILGASPDIQGIVTGVIIVAAVAVDFIRKK